MDPLNLDFSLSFFFYFRSSYEKKKFQTASFFLFLLTNNALPFIHFALRLLLVDILLFVKIQHVFFFFFFVQIKVDWLSLLPCYFSGKRHRVAYVDFFFFSDVALVDPLFNTVVNVWDHWVANETTSGLWAPAWQTPPTMAYFSPALVFFPWCNGAISTL